MSNKVITYSQFTDMNFYYLKNLNSFNLYISTYCLASKQCLLLISYLLILLDVVSCIIRVKSKFKKNDKKNKCKDINFSSFDQ